MKSDGVVCLADTVISDELIQIYQDAIYCFTFEEKIIEFKVGVESKGLMDFYNRTKSNCFAFITAFNPHGVLTSLNDNLNMQKGLMQEVSSMGYSFLEGYGGDAAGEWPKEDSICILGLSFDSACNLGNKFLQNAIVYCEKDAIPKVVVLR